MLLLLLLLLPKLNGSGSQPANKKHLCDANAGLALDAAKAGHQALPLGAQTHALYALHCALGSSSKDFGSVMELLRK